jgi:hypothetical protein
MSQTLRAIDLAHPSLAGVWADGAPNWLTAIATWGALVAAVFAGVTAKRLYDADRERDLKAAVAERSRQASQVVGWASWTNYSRVALKLPEGGTSRVNLAVRNASGVPVYDVSVDYWCRGEHLGGQTFSVLSPTGEDPHHREIKAAGVGALVAKPRDPDARLDIRVAIEFTDALGVRWRRDPAGRLSELEDHLPEWTASAS